jgi:hypothetical protein
MAAAAKARVTRDRVCILFPFPNELEPARPVHAAGGQSPVRNLNRRPTRDIPEKKIRPPQLAIIPSIRKPRRTNGRGSLGALPQHTAGGVFDASRSPGARLKEDPALDQAGSPVGSPPHRAANAGAFRRGPRRHNSSGAIRARSAAGAALPTEFAPGLNVAYNHCSATPSLSSRISSPVVSRLHIR